MPSPLTSASDAIRCDPLYAKDHRIPQAHNNKMMYYACLIVIWGTCLHHKARRNILLNLSVP